TCAAQVWGARGEGMHLRAGRRPASRTTPSVGDLRGRLEGRLVVLEPLAADHELGLFEAARDGNLFAWLPENLAHSREELHSWLTWSLSAAQADREVPFAILEAESGKPVGSTRF